MAKYKHYDYSQGKFIPIGFDKQILPGTFEHTLHYIIDNDLDFSVFDLRCQNDETGAPAYGPRVLLKIVLYAYSKGITSSRRIADCCNENVVFLALSADTLLTLPPSPTSSHRKTRADCRGISSTHGRKHYTLTAVRFTDSCY